MRPPALQHPSDGAEVAGSPFWSRAVVVCYWALVAHALPLLGGIVYVVTDHPTLSAMALFVTATALALALPGRSRRPVVAGIQSVLLLASLALATHELIVNDYYFRPHHVRLLVLSGLPTMALGALLGRAARPVGGTARLLLSSALFVAGWLFWRSEQPAHIDVLRFGLVGGTFGAMAATAFFAVAVLHGDLPPGWRALARRGAVHASALALLGSIAFAWSIVAFAQSVRQVRSCAALSRAAEALAAWSVANDGIPSTHGTLLPLPSQLFPDYLDSAYASDGWARPIVYMSDGNGFLVASLGSDGKADAARAPEVLSGQRPHDVLRGVHGWRQDIVRVVHRKEGGSGFEVECQSWPEGRSCD